MLIIILIPDEYTFSLIRKITLKNIFYISKILFQRKVKFQPLSSIDISFLSSIFLSTNKATRIVNDLSRALCTRTVAHSERIKLQPCMFKRRKFCSLLRIYPILCCPRFPFFFFFFTQKRNHTRSTQVKKKKKGAKAFQLFLCISQSEHASKKKKKIRIERIREIIDRSIDTSSVTGIASSSSAGIRQ